MQAPKQNQRKQKRLRRRTLAFNSGLCFDGIHHFHHFIRIHSFIHSVGVHGTKKCFRFRAFEFGTIVNIYTRLVCKLAAPSDTGSLVAVPCGGRRPRPNSAKSCLDGQQQQQPVASSPSHQCDQLFGRLALVRADGVAEFSRNGRR